MPAMRLLTGFVTAPSTTFTAATMASGDSLTVGNTDLNNPIYLLNIWGDHQTAGNIRLRSPKLHDINQGIRLFNVASEVQPLLPWGLKEQLYPQDTLELMITGSATSGDIETACLLVYYANLPGQDAQLVRWAEIMNRIAHIFTVENTLALGTAGGYSGEEGITAEFDFGKANTKYALLGYQVSAECAAIGYRGSDLGGFRVGGPGNEIYKKMTAGWFKDMSMVLDLPTIPVFNWSNKGSILIDGVQDENGTDTTVTSLFAELRS
jgi:hypothetical protein